jgi:hypothetical protein
MGGQAYRLLAPFLKHNKMFGGATKSGAGLAGELKEERATLPGMVYNRLLSGNS